MYLKGKFIALNAYIRKGERSNINDLSFLFKKLGEKMRKSHPWKNRRK